MSQAECGLELAKWSCAIVMVMVAPSTAASLVSTSSSFYARTDRLRRVSVIETLAEMWDSSHNGTMKVMACDCCRKDLRGTDLVMAVTDADLVLDCSRARPATLQSQAD